MLRDSIENGHNEVSESNLQITGKGYRHTRRGKISEALFINNSKPSFNKKDKSVSLQIVN